MHKHYYESVADFSCVCHASTHTHTTHTHNTHKHHTHSHTQLPQIHTHHTQTPTPLKHTHHTHPRHRHTNPTHTHPTCTHPTHTSHTRTQTIHEERNIYSSLLAIKAKSYYSCFKFKIFYLMLYNCYTLGLSP